MEDTALFVIFDAFPSGSPSHTLFIATIRIARANLPIRSKRKSLCRCHTERRNSKQTADESTFVQEKHEHLDSDGPALVLTCLDMSLHDSLISLSESIGEWKPTAQECKSTTSQGFRATAKNISHDARADNLVVGPRLKKNETTPANHLTHLFLPDMPVFCQLISFFWLVAAPANDFQLVLLSPCFRVQPPVLAPVHPHVGCWLTPRRCFHFIWHPHAFWIFLS